MTRIKIINNKLMITFNLHLNNNNNNNNNNLNFNKFNYDLHLNDNNVNDSKLLFNEFVIKITIIKIRNNK